MSKYNKYQPIKHWFMVELFELYKKYNVTISHEDGHGAFLLDFEGTDEEQQGDKEWIAAAFITVHSKRQPTDEQIALGGYDE